MPVPRPFGVLILAFAVVPVSDAHEYAIWVSYVEIYNEKFYDLLDEPGAPSQAANVGLGVIAAPSFSTMSLASLASSAGSFARQPAHGFGGTYGYHDSSVKRKALSLKHDKDEGNKYISGLKEVRVWSAEVSFSDTCSLYRLLAQTQSFCRKRAPCYAKGQINRRVFSTLLNRASSRSHGVFTIKVVRVPTGIPLNNPDLAAAHASVSRLSIVDLAGSERIRNAKTVGDRVKEAGNINKSLMVLGQCMEVLRRNQQRERGRKVGDFDVAILHRLGLTHSGNSSRRSSLSDIPNSPNCFNRSSPGTAEPP